MLQGSMLWRRVRFNAINGYHPHVYLEFSFLNTKNLLQFFLMVISYITIKVII